MHAGGLSKCSTNKLHPQSAFSMLRQALTEVLSLALNSRVVQKALKNSSAPVPVS